MRPLVHAGADLVGEDVGVEGDIPLLSTWMKEGQLVKGYGARCREMRRTFSWKVPNVGDDAHNVTLLTRHSDSLST